MGFFEAYLFHSGNPSFYGGSLARAREINQREDYCVKDSSVNLPSFDNLWPSFILMILPSLIIKVPFFKTLVPFSITTKRLSGKLFFVGCSIHDAFDL